MNIASDARLSEDVSLRMGSLFDAETGIIERLVLGTADGKEGTLPVCAAAFLRKQGADVGFGKGISQSEALIGAVGEALEIHCSSQISSTNTCYQRLADVHGDVLDPRDLCLYEDECYNRPGFPYSRFDPNRPIGWVQGFWFGTDDPVWLPAQLTSHNFSAERGEAFCQITSSGSACGLDIREAAMRAVLELLEHDAFMITWLCRLPTYELMLDHYLTDERYELLREQLQAAGARVRVYLLHAGINIPIVACVTRGDGKGWPGATIGLGSHPDIRIAIQKAMLEVGQTGPSLRLAMTSEADRIPARMSDVESFRQHALYYVFKQRQSPFDFLEHRKLSHPPYDYSNVGEISEAEMIEMLRPHGIRIAIADLTSSDLRQTPFRVVRALGRYLQPIHYGFGFERTANPRLRQYLRGPINKDVHPLC